MEINKYFKCLCPNKFVADYFLFVVLLDSSYILDEIDDKIGKNVCLALRRFHRSCTLQFHQRPGRGFD